MAANEYTITIDRREKKPLRFPEHLVVAAPGQNPSKKQAQTVRLRTELRTIETADYRLDDHPTNCYAVDAERTGYVAIETKRSLHEIAGNTLTDKRRATLGRCLDRMAELPGTALVVFEQPNSELRLTEPERAVAYDTFLRMLLERGLPWLSISSNSLRQRERTAELVARFLIQGARTNARR